MHTLPATSLLKNNDLRDGLLQLECTLLCTEITEVYKQLMSKHLQVCTRREEGQKCEGECAQTVKMTVHRFLKVADRRLLRADSLSTKSTIKSRLRFAVLKNIATKA